MNYMDSYDFTPTIEEFKKIDWTNSPREPGYILLSVFCRAFTKEFWAVQIVVAAITNITIFFFIKKTCQNPFVGVLFYFFMACFYFSTEIMREGIAIGIFLVNYIINIRKKNYTKYYFFCLLSLMFHYSALITFLFPLLKNLKLNLIYWILFGGLIGSTPLFLQFNELLSFAAIQMKMDAYINQAEGVNLNFRIANLLYLAMPAFIAFYYTYIKKQDFQFKNMILVHLLLCAGVMALPVVFQRFTNYTLMFIVCAITNIVLSYRLKAFAKSVVTILVFLSYGYYYSHNIYRWYPYVSIFNPHDVPERLEIRENIFGK